MEAHISSYILTLRMVNHPRSRSPSAFGSEYEIYCDFDARCLRFKVKVTLWSSDDKARQPQAESKKP